MVSPLISWEINIEVTPYTIQEAVENGTASSLIGLVKQFGGMFKKDIKKLYAEYADPKTNPHGYTMPTELDEVLQNL